MFILLIILRISQKILILLYLNNKTQKKQPFIYIPLFRKCLFTRVIFQYNYL